MKPCLLLLACAVPLLAQSGIVQTREGTTYLGSIRLEPDRLIVANVDREELIPINADNLRRASFDHEVEALSDEAVRQSWSSLPAPWGTASLGGATGQNEWRGGLFRIDVSGDAAQERVERFVYQSADDQVELIARVLAVSEEGGSSTVAGLTIRESLRLDARLVFLGLSGSRGGILQWRDQPGTPLRSAPLQGMSAPCWLRLKRDGKEISVFRSNTGHRWQLVERLEVSLGEGTLAGLSVVGAGQQPLREPGQARSEGLAVMDNVRIGRSLPITSFVPRARLRSGSVITGVMDSPDGRTISFLGPLPRPALRVEDVVSLEFQWPTSKVLAGLESGRAGVFLNNGEFVEGEFRGMEGAQLRMSSVLFGNKSYDLNNEVMAVVLRTHLDAAAPYEIVTADGSSWRASALEIGEHEVYLREPALGRVRISAHNLIEIRRNAE